MNPEAWLRESIELAVRSVLEGGGPFGSVVVRAGRVVGRGVNRVVPERDPSAHAEVRAIRAAARNLGTHDLSDCELYASCEPCPMCLGAIYWARIRRVHYAATRVDAAEAGFDDGRFYAELALDPSQRSLPVVQLPSDEALSPFESWEQKADRTPY